MNQKPIKAILLLISSLFFTLSASAEIRPLVEGSDYQVMSPKGSKSAEVYEFFSYACGACYGMESFIEQFKKENQNIKIIPVPTDLGHAQWTIYIKAFYLGDMLKVLDKSHSKIFHRVNIEKKPIVNEKGLKAFFVELGVDPKRYDKANKSFSLDSKIRKAKQLIRTYQISGTPTFVANQQYKLDNKVLGTTEMISKALKDLTNIEK